jgi:putative membrane protein
MKKVTAFFALCAACILLSWTDIPYNSARQAQADRAFAMKAARGNLAEIAAGKIAAEKGASPDVRDFGKMMVADHTLALKKLDSIVRKNNGAALPAEPDARHRKKAQELQALSDKQFDAAYIDAQVKDHKETIALFEKESSAGQDPALKSYAIETLPQLRTHLMRIQAIASASGTARQ